MRIYMDQTIFSPLLGEMSRSDRGVLIQMKKDYREPALMGDPALAGEGLLFKKGKDYRRSA